MTTKERPREKLVELVRKLLALSKSPNEHEAAAALAKVQELLIKYNLDLAEIGEDHNGPEPVEPNIVEGGPAKEGPWRGVMAGAVARAYFCRLLIYAGSHQLLFIGQKTDTEVARALFLWLVEQIRARCSLAVKLRTNGYEREPVFRRSFLMAAAWEVNGRMHRLRQGIQEANDPNTRALVVRKDVLVDQYIKDHYPKLGKRRALNGSSSSEGYRAGRAAGAQVDISGPGRKLGSGSLRLPGGSS